MIVSVVIPAWNAAAFLARALDSVRAQSYADFEIIVVDDGSTDATADVAMHYFTSNGMRGRVVRQINRGVSAARNAGIRAASGEFVALLDADDRWYPDKLLAVMHRFDTNRDADLVCHDENVTRDGRMVRVLRRRDPGGRMYEALLFRGNILSPSAVTMRRAAALALGGFDERPEYASVEDYDFWMRFSRERKIRFLPKVLGEYVLHEQSASRRIVWHHQALEGMLTDHLIAYAARHPSIVTRIRTRRRLAMVYRSAARQLLAYGEAAAVQRTYVVRMLRTYPFEPRNLAVALLWLANGVRRVGRVKAIEGRH